MNVSDRIIKPIADAIGANDDRVTNASSSRPSATSTSSLADLFRYQEWCDEREASGAATRGAGAPAPLAADVAALGGDKEAKRSACAAVLQGPEEGLNKMRQVAEDLDAGENIDTSTCGSTSCSSRRTSGATPRRGCTTATSTSNSNRLVTFSDDVAQGLRGGARQVGGAGHLREAGAGAQPDHRQHLPQVRESRRRRAVGDGHPDAPQPPNTGGCCIL